MKKLKYKKICIVSSSRAELGQLSGLIKLFQKSKNFKLDFVITGMHLNKYSNYSYKEANLFNLKVGKKINIQMKKFERKDISIYFSKFTNNFSKYFSKNRPDVLLMLGDRYETLAITSVAYLQNIPIAHLHGGEITSGSKDDSIRHAISKLANFHFVSNKLFKKRLVNMGECSNNIFISGMPGLSSIKNQKLYTRKYLKKNLRLNFNKKNIIISIHPEFDKDNTSNLSNNLFDVLKKIKNTNKFICSPNADAYRDIILKKINKYLTKDKNAYYFENLGMVKYLSLAKQCDFVIGNSSSIITEMPYIGIPSINIGQRQMGRPMAKSVLSAGSSKVDLKKKINRLLRQKKNTVKKQKLYYFENNSNKYIYNVLNNLNFDQVKFKIFKDK